MKRLIALFLFFVGIVPSLAMAEMNIGIPALVTFTADTLAVSPITGTGNSQVAWCTLAGSTLYHKGFYITEPSGTYDLMIAYNASTYPVTWKLVHATTLDRTIYCPSGVAVNLTFTTIHEGTTAPTVTINYQSWK